MCALLNVCCQISYIDFFNILCLSTTLKNETPTDTSPTKAATEFWEKDPDAELGILTSTTMTANLNLTDNYQVRQTLFPRPWGYSFILRV